MVERLKEAYTVTQIKAIRIPVGGQGNETGSNLRLEDSWTRQEQQESSTSVDLARKCGFESSSVHFARDDDEN